MRRAIPFLFSATLAWTLVACDNLGPSSSQLAGAFASLPLGYDVALSTFAGDPTGSTGEWAPPGGPGRGGRGGSDPHGGGGLGLGGSMMWGGLGGFFGGGPFGFGFGGGLFDVRVMLPGTCGFNTASGRVTCDPMTRDGLVIVRSAAYTDAAGVVQTAFDGPTTNTINVRVDVSGTVLRRRGDMSTVQHTSDRTVSGLAPGSTQHTVNGTSAGLETIKGSNDQGSFTAVRTIGDTTLSVVVPARPDPLNYPTAGTVIRSAVVKLTYTGQSATTSTRREVVTYDGTSTATVAITQDGTTKNCTLPLPRGRPVCP
jgi:hypothetical protein